MRDHSNIFVGFVLFQTLRKLWNFINILYIAKSEIRIKCDRTVYVNASVLQASSKEESNTASTNLMTLFNCLPCLAWIYGKILSNSFSGMLSPLQTQR
jgi:hypothetical protein